MTSTGDALTRWTDHVDEAERLLRAAGAIDRPRAIPGLMTAAPAPSTDPSPRQQFMLAQAQVHALLAQVLRSGPPV